MPFDPSIPFKVDLPTSHRPIERYLTLRDMMDQRRVREAQMRRLEMQEQEGLEEQQEIQGIRELFRTNPRPTPADIYRVAPTKGGPIVKGMFDQLTQERLAAKAAEELTEAKAKNKKNQEIILGNRQFALLEEPDDAKRNAAWGELSKELVELGYTTPEEAAAPPPDLPTLSRMAHQFYVATQGPEKAQERLTKAQTEADRRAKERLDRSKQQIELAGYYAGTVKDQESLDRWLAIAPEEIAAGVDRVYSPGWLQKTQPALLTAQQRVQQAEQARLDSPDKVIEWMHQPGRTPEELARGKQMLDRMVQYRQDTRPVLAGQDIGGLVGAVMKNPAAFAQLPADVKSTILPALTTAGFQPPPPEDYKKQSLAIQNTRDALTAYRKELETYSPTVRPGTPEYAKLQGAYRNLQLRAKDAAQLGALTGPDMKILDELLGDPLSWAGRYSGGKTLSAQVDVFGEALTKSEQRLRETYKQPAAAGPGGIPSPVVRWGKDAQGNPVRLP